MPLWKNDDELFALARRELFTAVVGDIMDGLGLRHQFLPPQLRPLAEGMQIVGRAMTVLEADVFDPAPPHGANPLLARPFGLMLEALDDLRPGEVYLCSGASKSYALWGELMSTRAMTLGAAGAICDGYHRDTDGIRRLGFPVFSHGPFAQDQAPRGKVLDYRVPLEVGGTRVEPGDLVLADVDGVCIVPRHAEAEVLAKALDKARGEKLVKKAIESGLSAQAAFEKFGIM